MVEESLSVLAGGFLEYPGLCYCCLPGHTADVRHYMVGEGLEVGSPLPHREVVNNLAKIGNKMAGLSSYGLLGKQSG